MKTNKERLVGVLKQKGYHVSTAESCTGGLIAANIIDISGASDIFEEGYITYSDRVKEKVLGVSAETIARHTVVSSEVAKEMAKGTQEKTGSELTISVTGYAGPGDAEDGTKAGTVYVGTCYKGKAEAKGFLFLGDRRQVREQAAEEAIRFGLERIENDE